MARLGPWVTVETLSGRRVRADVGPTAFVEIVSPIVDAKRALAKAIQDVPGGLAGASIAASSAGTLILNPAAWRLFEATLRHEVRDLVVIAPAREASQPLKFLLITASVPPSPKSDG